MGLRYTGVFENVSISAVQDAFYLKAGATWPVKLLGLEIFQNGNSDVGDAQEEDLRWQIKIGATTAGSGGSSVTARNGRGNTANTTVRANDTTQATGGTALTVLSSAFNIRNGLIWMPTPEYQEIFICPAATVIQIAFPAAPADAITFCGTVYFEELGT